MDDVHTESVDGVKPADMTDTLLVIKDLHDDATVTEDGFGVKGRKP
jgi:hypothetical protein